MKYLTILLLPFMFSCASMKKTREETRQQDQHQENTIVDSTGTTIQNTDEKQHGSEDSTGTTTTTEDAIEWIAGDDGVIKVGADSVKVAPGTVVKRTTRTTTETGQKRKETTGAKIQQTVTATQEKMATQKQDHHSVVTDVVNTTRKRGFPWWILILLAVAGGIWQRKCIIALFWRIVTYFKPSK